ncbi:MAG: UvrD-helicase domain-containing protein, partial [Bacteroidales bacterium]|nr:UvrD-helicase domain-containing protein [Bacteroidales bacterium]
MSVKILKASAGSGKTYRLSKTYIDLLLKSKASYPYRHILAVTFTNKATAEMKSRILRDLYNSEDPKARKLLVDILHDYSAFSVTTIDKFFQRAL